MSRISGVSDRVSGSPESLDRALITACAVVWLLVLGMGVAATVALVDLGRGHPTGDPSAGTPWLLYVIIGVSAVVIALAIPLLLRARRAALQDQAVAGTAGTSAALSAPAADRDPPGYPGPMPARASATALPAEFLDRIWLRCGIGVLTATGAAMLAVALAAYLLAVDAGTGAWSALGVAGVITVGMAAIPVLCLRQLKAALEDHQ